MAYTTIDKPSNILIRSLNWTGLVHLVELQELSFQPDWVWIKPEVSLTTMFWYLIRVRGVYKFIRTNLTDAEATNTNLMTSFNSDGFTLGSSD
jgi:hypothetical protein